MPSNFTKLFLLVAITLSFAMGTVATAQEGQTYITFSGDLVDDDKDRNVEDSTGLSIAIGKHYSERWNFEGFVHTADFDANGTSNSQSHLELGANALWMFNRDSMVSPYLLGGLSMLQVDADNGNDSEDAAASIGAGVLFKTSDRFAFRVQYRLRNQFGGDSLADHVFSLGMQFGFGDGTPKFVDSDGDGVADMADSCPNTPAGIAVDSRGCELDSDGDGVVDSKDKCPSTARGAKVNANGCELDSDGDGVANSKDKCPNTPRGAKVNANGCELDDDKDGVVNSKDKCPSTKAGVRVDVNGCEIKDVIRLPGVNFQSNSDRLLPGAEQVLNDAAATLKANSDLKVEVAGHTDSDGAADYNASLSERRARTVRNYLVARGANAANLTVKGYGESEPIASNADRAGKAQNRRVSLRISE